ncbi:MAG: RNA polymerase-associated protein RapA, partial [Pseudomonadota bacterium]
MDLVVGQRWVSQTETELGLGIVVGMEGRHVTVRFPVAEEDRVYASHDAPLARVIYQVGETLLDAEQVARVVTEVEDLDGLKFYLTQDADGAEKVVPETQISGLVQLSSPSQRLFSGQFDKNAEFQLRVSTLNQRFQLEQSPARGLLGPRTSLLPHQVYIAHEVAGRYSPRVLLADEVGLGKTIEAGMILHQQLQTGRAERALIVVPDALLHQWLVEMLRKFSLHFALFDHERYGALLESGEANPFESAQLVLCGVSLLVEHEEIQQHALEADWDMLIVDEAHHLAWTPDAASPAYRVVEALAARCAGLLLLTATPEQLGVAGHFARLRLIDPSRFTDMQSFQDEQAQYVELNALVQQIRSEQPLTAVQTRLLAQLTTDTQAAPTELIEQLLDRHGTGRVLFRNTRAAIAGFPRRLVEGHALEAPEELPPGVVYTGLQPERHLRELGIAWLRADPRVTWLEAFFKAHRQDKVLLICADAETAVDLEKHLHLNVGIRSAAFYEDLSIIERDRAAAYFAEPENGAQALICSEIGSEGRNFQFAHQLVLFDLPANPDLLEQRIGRLDRIGQTKDIQIHVPFVRGTAQEALFRWYADGMDAFCHSFSAGLAVLDHFSPRLQPMLEAPFVEADLLSLIDETRSFTDQLREQLSAGRDQLLEMNSCKPDVASAVIESIRASEQNEQLQDYMTGVFDTFGVEHEYHSEHSLVLTPTEHMLTGQFPLLGDDGLTVTFDRDKAQVREDMEFLSWESPIVSGVMELALGSELGNTAIGTLSLKSFTAGTLLLECFYVMQARA